MLVEIENFGVINRADLEIGKLNIIVGENSTGKSASAKLLFSLLTALSEGTLIGNENIKKRLVNFVDYWKFKGSDEMKLKLGQIKNSLQNAKTTQFKDMHSKITHILKENDFDDKDICMRDLKRLKNVIDINSDESSRYHAVFKHLICSEYGASLNEFKNADITFHGKSNGVTFKQKIGDASLSEDFLNYFNFQNVVYIDSPSLFENISCSPQLHLKMLERKLKNYDLYEDEFNNDLNQFKKSIDELIGGEFEYNVSDDVFIFKSDDKELPMQALSSGVKQVGILQVLVKNNELTRNTFLILDSPEANLHPDFQVKLAEILVSASKELNITLYITTHSPFMAEAFEVYARYYSILDETNFYLAEKIENKEKYDYIKLDENDILEAYNNLGYPFNTLNEVRFECDLRDDLG